MKKAKFHPKIVLPVKPAKQVDLHMHSFYSDGELSPKELVSLCAENKVDALAVTDHDSIACFEESKAACEALGIEWVPGVEFTCHDEDGEFHVLAYLWDLNHEGMLSLFSRYSSFREERAYHILDSLKKRGHHIQMEDVMEFSKTTNIGRPHIAMALVKKNIVPNFESAFSDLLSSQATKNLSDQKFTPEEVISTVSEAKGISGLAHPHKVNRDHKVARLTQIGLDGIETYFSQGSSFQVRKYKEMAKTYSLIKMGGSDFHNRTRSVPGKPKVPYSVLEKMKEHRAKKYS